MFVNEGELAKQAASDRIDLQGSILDAVLGDAKSLSKRRVWVDRKKLTAPLTCTVKTRYRQEDIPCVVTPLGDDRIEVRFDAPVAAVTPGQSAVFYQGEICLGGGIIEQRLPLQA